VDFKLRDSLKVFRGRRDTQSAAIKRRSRCGSDRGCPVLSLHSWPCPAPQVGQRTACTCLIVGFLAFTVIEDTATRNKKTVHFCTVNSVGLGEVGIGAAPTPRSERRMHSEIPIRYFGKTRPSGRDFVPKPWQGTMPCICFRYGYESMDCPLEIRCYCWRTVRTP
jgi:hypothetical protein